MMVQTIMIIHIFISFSCFMRGKFIQKTEKGECKYPVLDSRGTNLERNLGKENMVLKLSLKILNQTRVTVC